ncbi:MAG: hypothetical protein JW986_01225 [Methanotrichaceae archaeon]|nr:hypothetical protein [Methanotrichaceae archaeon]
MDYLIGYLIRAVAMVTIGVIVANIIMETNVLSILARPMASMVRASHLSQGCFMAALACVVDSTAGKSALSELYRRGEVSDSETIVTLLMSTFPVVLGESLFRVQAPVAIVLLGPALGGLYVMLNLFSSFLQSIAALLYSRLMMPCSSIPMEAPRSKGIVVTRDMLRRGFKRSLPILRRMLPIVFGTMILMDQLMRHGLMDLMAALFGPLLRTLGLPGECIAPLAMQFVHFSAGYASVAALLDQGSITQKQALVTLVVGSMGVITMIYLRYSLSMYLSLFGRFGARLTLITYIASMIAKVATIMLVLAIL